MANTYRLAHNALSAAFREWRDAVHVEPLPFGHRHPTTRSWQTHTKRGGPMCYRFVVERRCYCGAANLVTVTATFDGERVTLGRPLVQSHRGRPQRTGCGVVDA